MINFGDKGLIVQYIQNFLKDNYNSNIHLSDEYDKDTHKALIEYLMLPEIMDCYSLKDLLINTFTLREINPPNLLIDGGGIWNFDFDITPDTIRFYNRPINQCLSGALRFISTYLDKVDELCRQHGWYVADYTSFVYDENNTSVTTAEIILQQETRKQLLPTKDIINMINLSTNDYLLNKCFIDEDNSYHGFIEYSKKYKIAYIPAKPGDTFTISHGYCYSCEMAISYCEYSLTEIKEGNCTVNNIISHLNKSPYGEINAGQYEIYKIPEDSECKYLLIQMPFNNAFLNNSTQKIKIKIGDINQDGNITTTNDPMSDYSLLDKYVSAKMKGQQLPFNLTGANLIAANINKDVDINGEPLINDLDLNLFRSQINEGMPINFGETIYEKKIDLSTSDLDKLLIIYGDITENNKDNELNIPIEDYQITPWAIHDEFLPYILGSAIHKYSDIEDIIWLQNKVREFNSEYTGLRHGYYDSPEDYIINEEFIWNPNTTLYEYHKNGVYTGYVLDNKTNVLNGKLRRESDMTLSPIEILNGKVLYNHEWTGAFVLSNGKFTKEHAKNSLKEIIKSFQLKNNDHYKYQNTELIKFVNGYINPLTEKYLDLM